ncbi:MAG: Ig-like domain-containing protein [Thiothrix sp.]|uniref:Ig-like domain-containing protein n=1 Tax=Thiothrix sp. TaxID=1032 RepID=UPI0026176822|nr:Ig-like domain-containing protein [Thiothrix sp.]MDD5393224.1 Ig-like domain-containing protein [Thiothrix sp.]
MNNKKFRISRRALLPLLFCSAAVLAGDGGVEAPYGQMPPASQNALTLEDEAAVAPCDSGDPARGDCPEMAAEAPAMVASAEAAPAPDTMQQAQQLGKESDGFVDDASQTGAPSLNTGYVGGQTRIGVGIDSEFKGKADLSHVFTENEDSAVIGQGYVGVDPRKGTSTGHITGAGAKLNYHWVSKDGAGQVSHVNKVYGAYDQNGASDKDGKQGKKVTVGYGQERENMFWSGSVMKGLSSKADTGMKDANGNTIYEKAYDWGVGGRVGTFISEQQMRVQGGLDYEWGSEHAANESKAKQLTLTGGVEKFIPDSPHSVNANVDVYKKSGGYEDGSQKTQVRGGVGYRYDIASEAGIWQADKMYRRVRTEIPGESVKQPPKIERKLVKHTMELEADTFFKVDSAKLTPEAQDRLKAVIAQMRASGHEGNIRISGNTCDIGSTAHNQSLSERRAKSVREFLVKQGFTADELIAEGLGETHPKYPNTKAERHKNRRVDIEYVSYQSEYKDQVIEQGGTTATDPKVVWKQELIPSPPLWVRQALHNVADHKQRVDTYKTTAGGAPAVCSIAADNDDYPVAKDSTDNPLNVLDGDEGCDSTITITAVGTPEHGTVTIHPDGEWVVYTPTTGYTGSDTFTYTITDADGHTSTATVTVTVGSGACSIAADDDDYGNIKNGDSATPMNVFDGDTDCGGSPITDPKSVTVNIVAPPTHGTVDIGTDGYPFYTPGASYVDSDSFTYTITANGHTSNVATVTIGACPSTGSCSCAADKVGSFSYAYNNVTPAVGSINPASYLDSADVIESVSFDAASSLASKQFYATTVSGTPIYAGVFAVQSDNTIKFTQSSNGYCQNGTLVFYIKKQGCDAPIKVTIDVTQTAPAP